MTGFLSFQGADIGFRTRAVLRHVNLDFREGESVGLVGPNGSGKTTFLRTALGLLPPRAGRVLRPPRRFAYVPQADSVNDRWPLTLRELVELPARATRLFGRLSAEARGRAEAALERTGIAPIAGRLFREVSGGQRQRAVIAQALAQAPDVVLLDEPTRGLDVVAERDLLGLVDRLAEEGKTVFLVSHSLHVPLNHSQRLLLFHEGAVVSTTPREIVETRRLESVYGVPFVHVEHEGQRWAVPAGGGR